MKITNNSIIICSNKISGPLWAESRNGGFPLQEENDSGSVSISRRHHGAILHTPVRKLITEGHKVKKNNIDKKPREKQAQYTNHKIAKLQKNANRCFES